MYLATQERIYSVVFCLILVTTSVLYSQKSTGPVKQLRTYQEGNLLHTHIFFDRQRLPLYSIHTIDEDVAAENNVRSIEVRIALPRGYRLKETVSAKSTEVLKKQVASAMHSSVFFEGEEWYRGVRCARVRVTTNAEVSLPDSIALDIPLDVASDAVRDAVAGDPYFQKTKALIMPDISFSATSFTSLQWQDTTGTWIEYEREYLKLGIGDDGIYRLTKGDLQAYLPSTVDPRTFRLFNKGKEIPLYVAGEEDGSFDEGDYLEFPALRNYNEKDYRIIPSATEEYPQYMDRYSDTSYYWLTWGGGSGKRVTIDSGIPAAVDTLLWYPEMIHLEQDKWMLVIGSDNVANQVPYWQLNDMWGWGFFSAGGKVNISAATNNLYAGVGGKVYARFTNYGASSTTPQKVWLTVNTSSVLDSVVLPRFGHALLSGEVPAADLKNGANTITLSSATLTSGWNTMTYDWFDFEYPRKLVAVNDSLLVLFRWLSSKQHNTIRMEGFSTSQVLLYKLDSTVVKITDYELKTQGNTYTVLFNDTVSSSGRYFAFAEGKVKKPVLYGSRRFRNLRSSELGADYILLTASPFLTIAADYCSFIQQQKGLRTAVVNVEDVFDEFSYGYPTPLAIRDFLKATTRWQLPMPSYVFLVGDGTYDHKYALAGTDKSLWPPNYIPPFGYPVSDVLFTVFEEAGPLPQMYIGRLPAQSVIEFSRYADWHKAYYTQKYDEWNKTFLMFSGGDPKTSEIELFRQVNENVINQYILPAPIGGAATHFYKTASPPSDFGPYSPQEVQTAIDNGAIAINYIGHSGTQTWDNGITTINQLRNNSNRYPLIADFGCSTAKFAESNIRSFGELFVTQTEAPAIGYIGNSSLGFVSFAQTLPPLFYETLLRDSVHEIGNAHLQAKLKRIEAAGGVQSSLNQILLYTNTLLGDPSVTLALPEKPNLNIRENDIVTEPAIPTDQHSTLRVLFPYLNTGTVVADSFSMRIVHHYQQNEHDTLVYRMCPLFHDTLTVEYPIANQPGEHRFTVSLNTTNTLDELEFSDNNATKSVAVLSNAFRLIDPLSGYKRFTNTLVFLNPVQTEKQEGTVQLQIDTTASFYTPQQFEQPMGTVVTKFVIPELARGQKYYWRARIKGTESAWSEGFFSTGYDSLLRWELWGEEWNTATERFQTRYFPNRGIQLDSLFRKINIVAASFYEGAYGSVKFDGAEVLPNTFWWGHSVIVLDTITVEPKSVAQFTISDASGAEATRLATFLENLPDGTVIIQIVSNDGAQGLTNRIRQAVKAFGSIYIDSIKYRDSWIMIGKKGSAPGTAREVWHKGQANVNDPSMLDTILYRRVFSGSIASEDIGPAGKWNDLLLTTVQPHNTSIALTLLGKRRNNSYDTLFHNITDTLVSLSAISANIYPYLKLQAAFNADSAGVSPILKAARLSFTLPAELGLSQKTIEVTGDSLLEGNTVQIKATVHNTGSVPADSFKVLAGVLTAHGRLPLDTFLIQHLPPESSVTVVYSLQTNGLQGINSVVIQVDPDDDVVELFKGNNIYTAGFYVQRDTIAPTFDITFDGRRILAGDYVLAKPTIRIAITDNSPIPLTNPADVFLALDGRRVTLSATPESLFVPQSQDEGAYVLYRPTLAKGSHMLEVRVKDASGNWSDSIATKIHFKVETEPRLLNVFAYPNPFSRETYFTFNITGSAMPEEVMIKIYTVAGRLIRTLRLFQGDLLPGFNRVYWNGRDEEGDEIANGVYLYKVIMNVAGENVEVIDKLAKLR